MTPNLKPLNQQVIVITGASSGIGLVTARSAARRGAKVVLVARNEPALVEACAEITAAGGSATYAVADVGEASQVEAAATVAISRFGRIDTWVNDAGVAIYARLADTPLDEHKKLFQTNYFGVVNGATTALDYLRARGGALITIASIASDIPSPIMGAYSASKHAVKGYIESLRIEANADGLPVSITLIKPSGIDTPIARHAANHGDGEAQIPPPVYDPQLVADAILFAAETPRREITVGGVGRLQVLAGTHFPGLLAKFGGAMIPALFDKSRAKTRSDNLFGSSNAGEERSGQTRGRRFSSYTAAQLHPVAATMIGLGAAAALGLALLRPRTRQR